MQPLQAAGKKMEALNEQEDKNEAVQQFIKERKKQLIDGAFQYIGKSKYFSKVNKEAWYYAETLKNYKELFNDPKKAEETVKLILNKIPAAQKFMQRNSLLASMFSIPGNTDVAQNFAGLQTRASLQNLLQSQIGNASGSALQSIQQNIGQAHSLLDELKSKVQQMGGSNSDAAFAGFKPNNQKSKTFFQRIETGTNFQTVSSNLYFPATTDLGFSVGYKLNDKSVIGIGASYKLGLGRGWDNIQFSSQGLGLRSFLEWKLKGSFYMAGGYEMNYRNNFTTAVQLKNYEDWRRSALLGISKTINAKGKLFKKTKIQFLYDFLWNKELPLGKKINFRIGYNF